MKFDIITLFPNQIESFVKEGIFRIAQDTQVEINVHNLRDWTDDHHKTVDDSPFGGGAGMVMKLEPIFKAIESLKTDSTKIIITTPRGEKLSQEKLEKFSTETDHYIIICGHYEGIDERVHEYLADYEISIGDYVLSGGELPALVLVDGIVRLLPGVLGNKESLEDESFNDGVLEYPQYTRPAEFKGMSVPEILLSGDHEKVKEWRKNKSLESTRKNRPDLVKK